ncbi:MAG: hypothetical protein ACLVI9_05590 [Anaerostipes hadrus]
MLEQEESIHISKDEPEYEPYKEYLKQQHQILEFLDVVKKYQDRKQKEYKDLKNKR